MLIDVLLTIRACIHGEQVSGWFARYDLDIKFGISYIPLKPNASIRSGCYPWIRKSITGHSQHNPLYLIGDINFDLGRPVRIPPSFQCRHLFQLPIYDFNVRRHNKSLRFIDARTETIRP